SKNQKRGVIPSAVVARGIWRIRISLRFRWHQGLAARYQLSRASNERSSLGHSRQIPPLRLRSGLRRLRASGNNVRNDKLAATGPAQATCFTFLQEGSVALARANGSLACEKAYVRILVENFA